jgi:AcrR family transcriptional regulator
MTREEARKLLGGYATGTLTAAEREALFAAALEDQDLFDALAKDEPLREVLDDPSAKAELLAALAGPEPRAAWWRWRPLAAALAMAGIALAAVAVWRATREQPAPVIVARVEKAPAPPPAAAEPVPPAQAKPRQQAAPPRAKGSLPEGGARDAAKEEANAPRETAAAGAPSLPQPPVPALAPKAMVPAAAPGGAVPQQFQAQAPPPPPAPRQQAAAPSPTQQQQAQEPPAASAAPRAQAPTGSPAQQAQVQVQELQVERASARTVAVSSLRDAKGGVIGGIVGTGNAAAPFMQWTILRGDKGAPPNTVLDEGETVRLRIVARVAGALTLAEGDKVLAAAPVRESLPFETPPIRPTAAGTRVLRLTLTPATGTPLTWNLTLHYGK